MVENEEKKKYFHFAETCECAIAAKKQQNSYRFWFLNVFINIIIFRQYCVRTEKREKNKTKMMISKNGPAREEAKKKKAILSLQQTFCLKHSKAPQVILQY